MKVDLGEFTLECEFDPRIQNNASEKKVPIEDIGFIYNCVFKQKQAVIRAIEAKDIAEVYTNILSYSMNPNELLLNKQKLFHPCFNEISESFRHPKAMMEMDKIFYLPNDVLVKSDRVTMSTGLESRAPFLNHNLIEYSSSIPSNLLIGKNTNKWILREILNKYVPKHLTDRPKSGFSVPLRQWLMGPLNSWAREILLGPEIRRESIFDAKFIEKKYIIMFAIILGVAAAFMRKFVSNLKIKLLIKSK